MVCFWFYTEEEEKSGGNEEWVWVCVWVWVWVWLRKTGRGFGLGFKRLDVGKRLCNVVSDDSFRVFFFKYGYCKKEKEK